MERFIKEHKQEIDRVIMNTLAWLDNQRYKDSCKPGFEIRDRERRLWARYDPYLRDMAIELGYISDE